MSDGKKRVHFGEMSPQQRERLSKASKSKTVIGQDSATQILAIASGKGGVGKSTVTVNLAVALHNAGHKVGIIDCDVYGFSIPRMMGVEHVTPVIRDEKIVPVEAHGMRVISVGNFVEGNTPVIWRGPMLSKILEQFLSDVDWGELDYLLLDLPPGTGDVALDVVRLLPKSNLILVTTPQPWLPEWPAEPADGAQDEPTSFWAWWRTCLSLSVLIAVNKRHLR